jgi:endonuclease/exonuclease/phosphatase family metal-dependent hydrolase
LLDLYHWSEDKKTRQKMIAFFKEKNASVLCLQEFYSNNDSSGIDNINAIKEACDYPYVAECNMHVSKRGKWGSIIFSHLPIVDRHNFEIDVQGNNLLQKADVVFHNDTFSIFNVHLQSNSFNQREAALVNRESIDFSDSTVDQSKSIFNKLKNNAVNRGLEADIISSIISQSEKPLVLCGDLNDIPSSYVYFKIRNHLKDVFLEKGFGLGKTYRNTIAILRIDYIFHNEKIQLLGYDKYDIPYSDHEPLMANFTILHNSIF